MSCDTHLRLYRKLDLSPCFCFDFDLFWLVLPCHGLFCCFVVSEQQEKDRLAAAADDGRVPGVHGAARLRLMQGRGALAGVRGGHVASAACGQLERVGLKEGGVV